MDGWSAALPADNPTSDFATLEDSAQAERLRGLAVAALAKWGLGASRVELVKYRENAVFEVDGAGRRGVMRVHRPCYRSDLDIECELAWMRELDGAGIETPAAIASTDGSFVVTQAASGVPEPRQCDLLAWVEGKPPGTLEGGVSGTPESLRELYAAVGEVAARMHQLAASWRRPEPFSRPSWDIETLVGENPTFGRFEDLGVLDANQLRLLVRARDLARRRLETLGPAAALIHGDLVPDNILVDGERRRVIDFDDFGWSWAGFELATSLFPLQISGGFDAGLAGFLDGYRRVRAFPAADLEALPDLLMARGLSYLGWPAGRPEIESARRLAPLFAAMQTAAAADYLASRS